MEHKQIVGTEYKVLIQVDPVDGVHMEEMEFECMFYTRIQSPFVVKKAEMIRLDADSYVALVNTEGMSAGTLRNRMTVDIPDRDFPDDYRREVVDFSTEIKISK